MKKIRTRNFFRTLKIVGGLSAIFLLWLIVLGKKLATEHFDGLTMGVFAIFGIAAASFLLFSFMPYFKGDRRWYSISAMLTSVFFIGLVVLWNAAPIPEAVI
ncbi:MAG: hypothetical protein IJW16_01615 [Clostridia bacterium]|nr:hypothetical protein [Clostridia bacterium]